MKTYKASLSGTEYTFIGTALSEADKSWNWDKQIHECNGLQHLTVYEIEGNNVRPVSCKEAFEIMYRN